MYIKSKWGSVVFIVVGVIIALSNGYLFLVDHTPVRGLAFLFGIGWTGIGIGNLRSLQSGDP